jgi:hypothetical protein
MVVISFGTVEEFVNMVVGALVEAFDNMGVFGGHNI